MPSPDARARLEEQQAELVRALCGWGPPPTGFDAARVEAAMFSLLRKRMRAVAGAWPRLVEALGDGFAEAFPAFARRTPLPRQGAALADGRAFARELARTGGLPAQGRIEALAIDLRYAARADGLVLRRGFCVKGALFRHPFRLVVGMRCPIFGERWFCLGWPI